MNDSFYGAKYYAIMIGLGLNRIVTCSLGLGSIIILLISKATYTNILKVYDTIYKGMSY